MPIEISNFEKAIERKKKRLLEMPLPQGNAQAIIDFSEFCFTEGLSARRVLKYVYTLAIIAKWLPKKFSTAQRKDIEMLINKIERSDYAEWTKHDYKVTVKKFFKWLRKTEEGYPPEVRWICATVKNHRTKLPDEILTSGEIEAMVTAATNARDKALVSTLYESGCRIGELLELKIKQIQQHKHGLQITVNGKTGSRRLLLISCVPYVLKWLNEHPDYNNPQAYVWITSDYRIERLKHASVAAILRRIAKRASVRKAVNPHNFRHSRATHLAKHLTEAQMNEFMGWVQGSDMPSTYVHLSGRDVDEALLKLNNIHTDEDNKQPKDFSIKHCSRCNLENPPASRFCTRCGFTLDEKAASDMIKQSMERTKADEIMDRLLQDSEFRAMLERKLGEFASIYKASV